MTRTLFTTTSVLICLSRVVCIGKWRRRGATPVHLLVAVLLLAGSLAGCLDDPDPGCFEVPWPSVGSTAHYVDVRGPLTKSSYSNLTVEGPAQVLRGDGEWRPALVISLGTAAFYVDLATSDTLGGAWDGLNYFHLNYDGRGMRGPLLFGQCLKAGDVQVRGYDHPGSSFRVEVLEANRDHLVVEFVTRSVEAPEADEQIYRAVWRDRLPFANEVTVYDASSGFDAPRVAERLAEFRGETMPAPTEDPAAYRAVVDQGSTPCQEMRGRQPDLDALPAEVEFARYLANITADAALDAYLHAHPKACSAVTTYEIVTEPNSTAFVWSSVYADDTQEQYRKQFVVRCFHDPVLIALYGPCEERDRYHRVTPTGMIEGEPVDTTRIWTEPALDQAVENIEKVVDRPFTRFIWRVQSAHVADFLQPVVGAPGIGGFDFDFGHLEHHVRYVSPSGVDPSGGQASAEIIPVRLSGWITTAGDDLLRDGRVRPLA